MGEYNIAQICRNGHVVTEFAASQPATQEKFCAKCGLKTNALYYGDNLDILRRYVPDESVDLIYLDPPFNSNRDYNVIFKDESGRNSDAQLLAFEDTWH